MTQPKADIGLIGLAVMGQNLVLNLDDHGYTVAVFNRTTSRVDDFLAGAARGTRVIGTHSLEELVAALHPPRRVFLLVQAGAPVDAFIAALLPLLSPGDIIIDGGNSHYADTIRRTALVESHGLLYVGTGVSGGEEGARHGPSLMPGGSPDAWPHLREMFRAIAARTPDGEPCCDWVGSDGAGHYVKMVHNGIEYGDMQLIAEAYHLLRDGAGLSNEEMHLVFAEWNRGELDSYLIEITARHPGGPRRRGPLRARHHPGRRRAEGHGEVDRAVGRRPGGAHDAGGRGGLRPRPVRSQGGAEWRPPVSSGARLPPSPGIAPPSSRTSAGRSTPPRSSPTPRASCCCAGPPPSTAGNSTTAASPCCGAGGCIIRSRFLGEIRAAYARRPGLPNLLLDDFFRSAVDDCQAGWRRVVARAAEWGLPLPAMSSALAFFDGYRSGRLPANLLQAQRDYFGAHTYERVDRPRGEFFHTNWTGRGGQRVVHRLHRLTHRPAHRAGSPQAPPGPPAAPGSSWNSNTRSPICTSSPATAPARLRASSTPARARRWRRSRRPRAR